MSGERYLILSTQDDVAPAAELAGSVYTCLSLEQARNGELQELKGKPVLLWPDRDILRLRHMRAFAVQLVGHAERVRIIDPALAPLSVADSVSMGYNDWIALIAGDIDGTPKFQDITADAVQTASGPDRGPPSATDDAAPPYSASSPVPEAPDDEIDEIPSYFDDQTPPIGLPDPQDIEKSGVFTVDRSIIAWPEPMDLWGGIYKGASFPLELAPEAIQPLIADCADRTGIAPAAFFAGFLGAISGLCNDFVVLQPKTLDSKWTVRGVVWPLGVGGPSSGKSPGIEEGMKFVIEKDRAAVVENLKKAEIHKHEMGIYEDLCAVARKNKAPLPIDQRPPDPVYREYWVSRCTTEGVTRLLEHSPKVVAYVDEASALIAGFDRYTQGGKGSGDLEYWLMLYNGGSGKTVLAGKTVSIKNASAVFCGGTTTSALVKALGGKPKNDGFMSRTFIVNIPDMEVGRDAVPDAEAYATYDNLLETLLLQHEGCTLKMSPEASKIYAQFCLTVRDLVKRETNELLASHIGKWYGVAPRLMLIYFMADRASRGGLVTDGMLIPGDIARQCCRLLLDFELGHLRQFWNDIVGDKTASSFTQVIADFILAHDVELLSHNKHIVQPHFNRWNALNATEKQQVYIHLENAGWIMPQPLTKLNKEKLPMNSLVNLAVHEKFAARAHQERERRAAAAMAINQARADWKAREPGSDD